jgi:valine--pyruvate aminotransferase
MLPAGRAALRARAPLLACPRSAGCTRGWFSTVAEGGEAWTDFGRRFTADSGINRLMDDLADATRPGAPPVLMMGGGNPAQIPEVKEALRETMIKMLQDEPGEQSAPLLHAVSNYDGPPGGKGLVEAVAEHFSETYGWDISAENVALTNGSQSSFFYLFNALAGEEAGVGRKKVLFPLCPEYLGYAEVGLSDDMFTSVRPSIDIDEEANLYKYSIDFDRLEVEVDWSEIGVVCVSRPTNPTGNVLTDDEVERLDVLAKKHGIPLLIDNAYGTPFPSIIHVPATPVWNDNIILCLSLSKLGLPGEMHIPELITMNSHASGDVLARLSGNV